MTMATMVGFNSPPTLGPLILLAHTAAAHAHLYCTLWHEKHRLDPAILLLLLRRWLLIANERKRAVDGPNRAKSDA
uniref:Putative secreted protein n=1 Tax=Anopheles marajoara TaxID=58244 RepID=A0A2M4CCV0_9DIPT